MTNRSLLMISLRLIVVFLLAGAALAPADVAVAQAQGSPSGGAKLRDACRSDYERFCAGVTPGGGRGVACLRGQLPALSADCRRAVESRPPRG